MRQFIALCEAGSFHRAAETLHMAQPPLSVSMRKLEEELGCVLVVRHSKGITPTAPGELALAEARKVLAHVEQLAVVTGDARSGIRGSLRIGFVGSATYTLLPSLLPRFRREFPDVDLALEESTTINILAGLNERTLDIGLVRYPVLQRVRQHLTILETHPFAVAVPASGTLANRRRISLSSLHRQSFIAHSASAAPNLRAVFNMLCQEAGFVPDIVQEAVQVQTILSLVESGLGIALVPASAARFANDAVRFVELTPRSQSIETGIAMASQQDTSGALVRNFVRVAVANLEAKPRVLRGGASH
ncbi:MAG: LysR substrate-binding domain-containing protein [Pseudomonadota bacterium]